MYMRIIRVTMLWLNFFMFTMMDRQATRISHVQIRTRRIYSELCAC